MSKWWRLEAAAVAGRLGVKPERGLSRAEATARLERTGANSIRVAGGLSFFSVLIDQFKDFMVLVLIGAAILSWLLGEAADAATIIAIVLLNAALGCFQEYRAERSLQALRRLSAPQARVRRDGETQLVPADNVVPGDILLLEEGDRIAADARLINSAALAVSEAALTGESVPVAKTVKALSAAEPPLGDRINMVFAGTSVVAGRGEAVVTATGMSTELGRIAGMIGEAEPGPTPLQIRLEQVGRWLILGCLFICGAVGAAGIIRGEEPRIMFLAAVSLAVAAIPEGLPAVVTISLALGVQRMARRQAIVRRLPAVETLGCATVICSDKTGTLTRNEMTASAFVAGRVLYRVTGTGFDLQGTLNGPNGAPVSFRSWPGSLREAPPLLLALLTGSACNNAVLHEEKSGDERIEGDPTEAALLVLARKAGLDPKTLQQAWPRRGEVPFSSERKRMSVICRGRDGGLGIFLKGAVDTVLPLCKESILADGRTEPMTASSRAACQAEADKLAFRGLRVLALAYRPLAEMELARGSDREELERDLIYLGLVGLVDPPRPETARAVDICRTAGIRTVMITGDHPLTAKAVGGEIGLISSGGRIVVGEELDRMNQTELERAIGDISIFARVSPRHKLRIVRTLKARGQVVAMTGDGVNDAPAVKEADIGVAMGRTGTDVTKEAASLVITDDNFATIVAAVEEGRAIYDNIRKFIRYLLGCNSGEVLTMFLGMLLGLPLPLLPLQILWVNLITDGLPALALGLEPPEGAIMARPPRPPRESLFARGLWAKILWQGVSIGLSTLISFTAALILFPGGIARARTIAFTVLVLSQLIFAFFCRKETAISLRAGFRGNPYLLWTIIGSVLAQMGVIYLPWLARLFSCARLSLLDWGLVLGLSLWSMLMGQVYRPAGRLVRRAVPGRRPELAGKSIGS